jgi:hypothetical protein
LLNTIDKLTYYKRFSEYILKSKFYTVATRSNKGIVLRLLKVTYNKDDVYLVMEVKNNYGIDFEIDYLNISRVKGNKKLKALFQNLEQEVVHRHDVPSIIKNRGINRFVFVLSKFVLGENEK